MPNRGRKRPASGCGKVRLSAEMPLILWPGRRMELMTLRRAQTFGAGDVFRGTIFMAVQTRKNREGVGKIRV